MIVLLGIAVILLCLNVAADHPAEPAVAAAWVILALGAGIAMWREIWVRRDDE